MAYNANPVFGKCLATAVTVGNTPTLLPATALKGRKTMSVSNNSASGGATLYVGDSAVTTATGTPIPPQSSISLPFADTLLVYGISIAGGLDARVLEAV